MHHRSRSRLVMQFLSIIVIVTLVVPPGLAIAAPPIGQPQSSGPAPTSVSAPTATVSAWLSHIVRSARELLAEIQPTPTDSPLPSATAEIEPEETVTPSSPPTPVEQIITTLPEKGGSVALGSGRVEIRIPEGSLRESADVELSLFSPEGLDSDAKQVEPLVLFMLRLRKTDREEAVDKVARPIEAIVSIPRDVVELVNAGDKEVRLFRYAGDESKGFYIPSEQTLDAETGKLTATVELSDDAETTFGVMTTSSDDAPRGWILSWREPAVSEFSGAATYVYPIALPPARGNHQPNIDISYSSRDLDGRTKAAVDMNQGEIGVGWTINNIAVIREGAKVRQSSTSGFISFSHPDTFVLLINGIGYKLYTNQDVQNNIVRYYALNAPEVYVERRYDPNLADSNPDRFYWIVKTQDGTVYRLGYRDNSAAGQKMATCCSLASIEGHQGFDTDPSYQYSGIQWYVDMVTDVYNNQVQYIYEAWYETDNYEAYASGQWKQSAITTYHRRLKEIRYNFQGRTTGQYTWLNATPGTKVELVYTIDHRVDKIKLYHSNLSQPYRMIDLTVDTAWHDSCGQWTKTWRVTRITQQNADGSQALPPITFDYAPLAHTSGGCYIYDHLDEVHNGYGGGTRFIYGTQDGRQEPNVSSVEASYGRSYLVTQQQTWDSIHSQAAVTDYTYTKPCYNQTSGDLGDLAGAFNCPTSRHDADGPVVGFEETTVIRKNYNSATLNKTYTKFSQAMETIGRPLIHDTFSSDLIRLTRLETTYQAETVGPTSFNHPSLETLTRYVSSGQESTTKYYQYVTSQQAGVQYGQLTHVHEYDETGARKRITYYVYGANTSRWVIVPTQELTFDGSWNVKAGTFYLYDGATDPDGQSIGIGRLDSVRQRRIVPQGCPKTIETADTGYGYDVYGNVTSTTAYDDYGTVSCNSSGNWYGLSQPGQGVVKSTTATTYDSVYHLYPVVSCISQLSLCDYSNYYGFNQASISGSSGLPGQLQRRYDSNGTATAYVYVYDTFGRLDRVQAPGDAGLGDTQVSERYQYVSDGTPGQQRIISRQGRNATWQETYYDGMGRTIQVHQKADNGQEIRTTQEYDAFGRIIKSWIPYYGTHGEDGGYGTWGYVPADKSLSHTSNSYTAPEERVRTPDGYVTTTYAAGRRIITIDANGHRRDSILDALGRTIKVEEYNADPTTYEAEATGYHQTGSSNGSAWVSPAVGSGAAYLTYGPYAAPQAVGYKQAVRFRLAIDSISGNNDQIARIDVWDATAGQTLAERYLYRKDFEGGLDNFSEFVLVFDTTNRSGHSLEYRVYWQNKARMAHDRTVVSWRQASRVTQYTYDTLDHLTGIIDAGSNTTSIGYDGLGRKIQMTDPDMGRWSYDYDPRGNLAMQSDARACVIDFQYDAANRLTLKNYNTSASTCPASDPGNVNYTYDAYTSGTNYGRGHRTGMQDASGSTSWRYDVRGRMTRESKVISGQTFNTYHTYNAMDQVVTTTYPDGEAVTTGYNDAARPNTINGAVSYVSSASYSAAGQLTQQTFGNNVTTAYAYNPFSSRLTNIQTSDLLSFAYAYDKVGNLVHIDDHQDIQFSDSFDTKNTAAWVWNSYQTVPYTDGDGKVVHNDGTGSSYSANFYRNSHNLSHGEGLQVRFKVDRSDTAAHFSVESNNGTYRRFGVIANNGKVYVQYNNGGSWTYPKDLINPLKVDTWYVLQIRVNDSQGFTVEVYEENDPTQRGSYTRSMTGGLSWRFRHWIYQGSAYLDAYTEWSTTQRGTFIYDALDRLDEASVSGGGSGLYIRDYSYDAIGNLTYKTDTGGYNYTTSLGLSGCTAGTPATKPHAARSASAFGSFGYDCNGNMTSRTIGGTTRSLTYNADNLLHQIKQGSTVLATYTYDGDGTLVKKVAGGQTTVYVGPHYEKNLSTGEVTKYYSLDGQRVAMREGSTLTYLHSDHLGSASLATNSSGGMISEMRYYPYGATRWTYGTMPTDRRFTGQREETGFGLYDYVARRYDPVLGRFIQADSVVPEPGNPQSLNRYTYVLGNPLRYTDPTGHWYYDPGADALVHTREKHNEHPEYFELAKLRLYNYGKMLRRNPNLNAFDRFVALMDYAGASYDFTSQGTVDQYIVDITAVVHGYDYNDGAGWFFTGHGSNWSPFWLGNGAFEDEFHGVGVTTDDADLGWHADYRDGTGNQAYHFWFYAAVAYHDGGAVAFAGNFIHDGNQTWLGGRLSQPYTEYLYPRLPTYLSMEVGNKADYHLGVQGVYLGSQLRMFRDAGLGVHPAQVGAWLRMNLGE